MSVPRSAWPAWVKLGLGGVPSRNVADALAGLSALLGLSSGIVAAVTLNGLFLLGLGLLFASFWYASAANWVDRNGGAWR